MTTNADRKRQPAGITIGGQFATEPKQEAAVNLTAGTDIVDRAAELGAAHDGGVYLDHGKPFDVYELFEKVTGRSYDPSEYPQDETDILEVAQAFERAAGQRWGDAGVQLGSQSPWGEIDHVEHIAAGIVSVSTPSHGGVKLSAERNDKVPAALRKDDGWYEEDIESAIPTWAFPEELSTAHELESGRTASQADIDALREHATAIIRDWFPDQWEKATGETVTAEQSGFRARAQAQAEHADSMVAVASSYNQYDRPDVVTVRATLGAKSPSESAPQDVRIFEVPASEYNDPDRKGPFIIDPSRHVDVTDGPHAYV